MAYPRIRRLILWGCLGQWVIVAASVVLARAQPAPLPPPVVSQETINAVFDQRLDVLIWRLGVVEAETRRIEALAGRVSTLEADMLELKWIGRSVAVIVAGQLLTMLFGLRDKRREDVA